MANFALDIRAFVERYKERQHVIVRKIVLEIGTRIVERSPVRTGRFRANWQYGNTITGVPEGTLDDVDPSGAVSIDRISTGLPYDAGGLIHSLRNNLPYAQRLEEGWSKQAPAGMVGLAIAEFQALVAQVAEEEKDT